MDKPSLTKKLFDKKTKDYTYTVAFFFIFSFFVFYIIRPNLRTVFEINSKIEALKKVDAEYAAQIDKIVTVQSEIEKNREDWVYLDEAISYKPEVNKVLSDINISSDGSSLVSERITVSDINLKDKGSINKIKSFSVNLNLLGSFEEMMELVGRAYAQRRLKLIPELEMERDKSGSSESAKLKIKVEVEGFYL